MDELYKVEKEGDVTIVTIVTEGFHHDYNEDIKALFDKLNNEKVKKVIIDFKKVYTELVRDICTCDARFSGSDETEYKARGCPDCICNIKTNCIDCGTETEPGKGSARCEECWAARLGVEK